jgi:hypothetical protein
LPGLEEGKRINTEGTKAGAQRTQRRERRGNEREREREREKDNAEAQSSRRFAEKR